MHKLTKVAIALIVVVAGAMGPVTEASATLPATSVTPAGDYVKLKLVPGAGVFLYTVHCATSTSTPTQPLGTNARNQIPTTANPSTNGPVAFPLTRPTIADCLSPGGLTQIVMKAKGVWRVALQYKAAGDVATVTIPKGGITLDYHFGSLECGGTVAPTAAVKVVGTWTNATNGSPSQLRVDNQNVPFQFATHTGCPDSLMVWPVSFWYAVTDVSHSASNVAVS